MKKAFKKITVLVLLFTLVFTFTVKPKKADAVFAEMTLASWIAGGGYAAGSAAALAAAAPVIIGLAGAAAIGATIKNWDTIEAYGAGVWSDLTAKGVDPNSLITDDGMGNYGVTASPTFIKSASSAVDGLPETITNYNTEQFQIISGAKTVYKDNTGTTYDGYIPTKTVIPVQNLKNSTSYTIEFTTDVPLSEFGAYIGIENTSYAQLMFSVASARFENGKYYIARSTDSKATTYPPNRLSLEGKTYYNSTEIRISNVRLYETSYLTSGQQIAVSDTFGNVADNDYQRQLEANAALGENQLISINSAQDLTNATLSDLTDITAADYDESQTQTGILTQIWNNIKNLPTTIVAASAAAAASVNAAAQDLWEDAGAVWSGMADTMTNIKTDINTKVGALQDAMAGGIDNIRADIGGMVTNLGAGIDAVGANIAGWGQLTLDGIEAGVTSITTSLTDTWTNITAKITEGVGTITDAITTGIEYIAGMPAMLFSVFVPPSFDFVDPLINELQVDFDNKFSSFDAIDQIFQDIFGATKSIYDIQVTFFGRQYYIVPILLKPTIDSFRPFMTGLVDLYVVTYLYRRYKGNAVIPL